MVRDDKEEDQRHGTVPSLFDIMLSVNLPPINRKNYRVSITLALTILRFGKFSLSLSVSFSLSLFLPSSLSPTSLSQTARKSRVYTPPASLPHLSWSTLSHRKEKE